MQFVLKILKTKLTILKRKKIKKSILISLKTKLITLIIIKIQQKL